MHAVRRVGGDCRGLHHARVLHHVPGALPAPPPRRCAGPLCRGCWASTPFHSQLHGLKLAVPSSVRTPLQQSMGRTKGVVHTCEAGWWASAAQSVSYAHPSQRYLHIMQRGARHAKLDPRYVQWLQQLQPYWCACCAAATAPAAPSAIRSCTCSLLLLGGARRAPGAVHCAAKHHAVDVAEDSCLQSVL